MRRKVNTLRHIGVLFVTGVIFFLGVFIGGHIEDLRVESIYTQLQIQDLEFQTIVTESRYIEYLLLAPENSTNFNCSALKNSYFSSIDNLDVARSSLEHYINLAEENTDQFERLKEHYINLQITYWVLGKRIRSRCGGEFPSIILYFYGDKKQCPKCEDQGVHLDYIKSKLKEDVLIFSLDRNKKGAVELLSQSYGVYNAPLPSLVINERVYGFLDNEKVLEVLE